MGDPVMIDVDGHGWTPGTLLEWRWTDRDAGRWRAYVTFTLGVGEKYLHWVDGDRVRHVDVGEAAENPTLLHESGAADPVQHD